MYGRNRRSPSPPPRRGGGGGGARYQILIKNIPFDVDWKRLKDFIKDLAGVDVKFAQIVESKPGRSAGFGFAAFHSSNDMGMAIDRLNRQQINGREIFVVEDCELRELDRMKEQKGLSNTERRDYQRGDRDHHNQRSSGSSEPSLQGVPISQIPGLNTLDSETLESLGTGELSNKLFAYNLVYDVNERKLNDVFGMFGEVRNLMVPKKGHAIVEYRQSSEALRALIILRNQFLDGRKMMIKMDGAPFAKSTDNNRSFENKRPRMDDRGPERGPPPPDRGPPPPQYRSYGMHSHDAPRDAPRPPPPSGKKICVEGLPLSVTTSLIRQLFESMGPVDYVQLSDGGRCDLEYFESRHAIDASHRMNGYMLEGRPIKVYLV